MKLRGQHGLQVYRATPKAIARYPSWNGRWVLLTDEWAVVFMSDHSVRTLPYQRLAPDTWEQIYP